MCVFKDHTQMNMTQLLEYLSELEVLKARKEAS